MSRRGLLILLSCLLSGTLASSLAWSAPVPAPAGNVARENGNALGRLAEEVARSVVGILESPTAINVQAVSPSLADAFATLLAGKLAAQHRSVFVLAAKPDVAQQRARGAAARALVRVTLVEQRPELIAQVEVLGTWPNFWAGELPTRPASPAAASVSRVTEDAALLAFTAVGASAPVSPPTQVPTQPQLGPPMLPHLVLDAAPLARFEHPLAALAAADLDGDGKPELLVLADDELSVLAPDGRVLARRDLRALAPARVLTREAFGALSAGGTPLRVGYLDGKRAHGEWLEVDLAHGGFKPVSLADGLPCGPSADRLTMELALGRNELMVHGAPGSAAPGRDPVPPVTTCVGFERNGLQSRLHVFPDGRGDWDGKSLTRLGAGSALVDFDGHSRPVLVTSSERYAPSQDELRLFAGPEAPATATGVAVSGRILQVVAADVDGDGYAELVLGVWKDDGGAELWVARRVRP